MPLRIRCPHCQVITVVADELAGEQRTCDACFAAYTVPLPAGASSGDTIRTSVTVACPRCKAAVAPGTAYCPSCRTDSATGLRLPLGRRLRMLGVRHWTIVGAVTVVLIGTIWILTVATLERQHAAAHPPQAFEPTRHVETPAGPFAAALFAARNATERAAATQELVRLLPVAGLAVAKELERSLATTAGPQLRRNQLLAIDSLARAERPDALPVLERAGTNAALHAECVRSRALLGDERVVEETAALWRVRLRSAMFLARFSTLCGGRDRPGVTAALRAAQSEAERYAAALRRLGRPAIALLAEEAWSVCGWLGQEGFEAYAAGLFAIAMPAPLTDLSVQTAVVENVRAARDALKAVAADGTPSAQAAAALVLKQCAPQYESARERIVATLAGALPTATPREQQRIVWTLAELTGRPLVATSAGGHPDDVDATAVAAARRWAVEVGLGRSSAASVDVATYSGQPRLVRRVYTAARQLEHDLLRGLRGDWAMGRLATDGWLASDLPLTPRLAEMLSPTQRNPHHPALAGALVIAASRADAGAERAVELWCAAADQPAWVRNLARTAAAAIVARRGQASTSWPANLEHEAMLVLDGEAPGWTPFGRVLAAAGEALLRRVKDAPPEALPAGVRDRLLRAAEQALQMNALAPRR